MIVTATTAEKYAVAAAVREPEDRPRLLPGATVAEGVLGAHVPWHGGGGGADDVRAKAGRVAGRACPREESECQDQPEGHHAGQTHDDPRCCWHAAPRTSSFLTEVEAGPPDTSGTGAGLLTIADAAEPTRSAA